MVRKQFGKNPPTLYFGSHQVITEKVCYMYKFFSYLIVKIKYKLFINLIKNYIIQLHIIKFCIIYIVVK